MPGPVTSEASLVACNRLAARYPGADAPAISSITFAVELLPLMEKTAATGADVRVMSVLSGGVHSAYAGYRDDPDLERSFSIKNGADAAGFYNDIGLDSLARAHPTVSFSHVAPGFVATAWGSGFNPVLRGLIRGLQATLAKTPAKCASLISAALVADQYKGGFHVIDENGRPGKVTSQHEAARETVWAHTQEVLARFP